MKFSKPNVVRAGLMLLGVALAACVRAGYLPQEFATDISTAAGILFGTGVVQITGKS